MLRRGFLLSSSQRSKTSPKTTPKKVPPSEPPPPPFPIMSLPNVLIVDILARVPRSDHPKLSLVSKPFRSTVTSREIYSRRSSLGCTEHCLYVVLYNLKTKEDRCYILRKKHNGSHGLVLVPSLPAMPRGPYRPSYVVSGSKIYVFGEINDKNVTLTIDCETHTVKTLPSMPAPLVYTIADVIGGRIHVIGRHKKDLDKMMVVVFNIETQKWEHEKTTCEIEAGDMYHGSVVMGDDKMYTKDFDSSYVYDPKERKWERDEAMNAREWRYGCVVDDVLYYYECEEEGCVKELLGFDRKERCWRVVKGLERLLVETRDSLWSHAESYGAGRLALFFPKGGRSEIWCAEISLERRGGGEIWGKVEWCNRLVTGFQFTKSLDVVV